MSSKISSGQTIPQRSVSEDTRDAPESRSPHRRQDSQSQWQSGFAPLKRYPVHVHVESLLTTVWYVHCDDHWFLSILLNFE